MTVGIYGGSKFVLIDDIASMMDDVAAATKVAANKTAAVMTDDLAVNANKVTGSPAERELPVVWAVAKGSLINKIILVPLFLLISYLYPPLATWLLIFGGLFLCYEGAEKVLEKFLHHSHADTPGEAAVLTEAEKIKGAIRTDFVLSAEIIVISLGTMAALPFMSKVITLSIVSVGMTVLVYGLVAFLVKIDDIGLHLMKKKSVIMKKLGLLMLNSMPWIMHALSKIGVFAMFMVGGAILVHSHHGLHDATQLWLSNNLGAGFAKGLASVSLDVFVGLLVGCVLLLLMPVLGNLDPSGWFLKKLQKTKQS